MDSIVRSGMGSTPGFGHVQRSVFLTSQTLSSHAWSGQVRKARREVVDGGIELIGSHVVILSPLLGQPTDFPHHDDILFARRVTRVTARLTARV